MLVVRLERRSCAMTRWTVLWVLWSALFVVRAPLPLHAADAAPAAAARTAASLPDDRLLKQIDEVVAFTKTRVLDGRVHTPWQIVHGILGLRQDFLIQVDGQKLSAVDWLSTHGATFQGEPYFQKTEFGGRGHSFTKPMYFEGHPTQFLAYLSTCGLSLDFPIKSGDATLTVGDIVRDAQKQIRTGDEPGWTLWALSSYLPPDATWENKSGEAWSIERLVRSQTYEPVTTAACGGTHGLFALTWARGQYLKTEQPLRGVWLEADQKIRRYVEEARTLQNPDGSFSVDFFKGRRAVREAKDRLAASGHTLEFVVLALPESRLGEPWVRSGVSSLTRDLLETRKQALEPAPLYHAIDGLILYRDRVRAMAQRASGAVADIPAK
jgi:hypothetical protein